jgi:hypothetical protein
MSGPDGPEERTAFYEETFEREAEEIDRLEDDADDSALLDMADRRMEQLAVDRILDGGVFI